MHRIKIRLEYFEVFIFNFVIIYLEVFYYFSQNQVNSKEYENSEIQNNLNKEISRLNVRYLKQFIYIKFFIIINNKYVKASEQSLKINLEKEKNQVIQLKEEIIRLNQRLHETELLNDSTDNIQQLYNKDF